MEEPSDMQYAEDKALSDKNKRRRFKTPSQLQALEEFYNEHKYPTESMKAEVAEKLGLTEKQVSGWFCHRRLKDKKKEDIHARGRQDLSSDVIQDHGSGLKQDSCSSTKQGDHKVVDIREVESQQLCPDDYPPAELNHEPKRERFHRDEFHPLELNLKPKRERFHRDEFSPVELNYEPRRVHDEAGMDDTSSESNSALQESFYPEGRSTLNVETPAYQAPSGSIPMYRARVGPSGYLKIKCQAENAAITAVKRQLGRHYREDGPPLGIEFDPLPPGAFESPGKNMDNDAYRVLEPITSGSLDISGIHKRPGFRNIGEQETYVKGKGHRHLHLADQDNFSCSQLKQKHAFHNHSRGFPHQKSSIGGDLYSNRDIPGYDGSFNRNILYQHDSPRMASETYVDKHPGTFRGKLTSGLEEQFIPNYDVMNPKVARKRERLDSGPTASMIWHKASANMEGRMAPTSILKDEALYTERRPMSNHHKSVKLRRHPANDLRVGEEGGEGIMQEDYVIRTSSQEPSQRSRRVKGPTMEMPLSFSEDETAVTSSSVD